MRASLRLILGVLLCSQEALSLRVPPPLASRRRWLAGAGAAAAASAVPALASAAPSFVSSLQGPVQDAVAPGHWLGQLVGINSKTEEWTFADSSPAEVSAALVAVLAELTPARRELLLIPEFKVTQADASKVHVLTWTKAEWLDTLDVKLEKKGRGCVATASFYATGLLPTSIPLAPLVNVAFAWFPFGSPGPRGEMLQDFRLRALNGLLAKKLQGLKADNTRRDGDIGRGDN
uniref:Uncharacterized protein n=1 Tax=Phaeocystis antarctica TaxID=33657 RepID=A0A7S0ENH3_9EUKA